MEETRKERITAMQLTQKETDFLKDLKSQEMLCAEKYAKYAEAAHDPQLKNLFSKISGEEREHHSLLERMEQGEVPVMPAGTDTAPTFTATYTGETQEKKDDCYLCSDLLSMEKHVSHAYDTAVFEFKSEGARNLLNDIQKKEQEHGKAIYDYMTANGMYA